MRNGKNNVRVVRISNKMIKFMFHTNGLMFLLTVTLFFKHQIYTESSVLKSFNIFCYCELEFLYCER